MISIVFQILPPDIDYGIIPRINQKYLKIKMINSTRLDGDTKICELKFYGILVILDIFNHFWRAWSNIWQTPPEASPFHVIVVYELPLIEIS